MECTFDRTALLALVGDARVTQELAGLILEESPRQVAAIRAARHSADAPRLRLTAHTLAGTLGMFDAGTAYQAARQLESLGRATDVEGGRQAFAVLEQALSP